VQNRHLDARHLKLRIPQNVDLFGMNTFTHEVCSGCRFLASGADLRVECNTTAAGAVGPPESRRMSVQYVVKRSRIVGDDAGDHGMQIA
jgi:hypothetical protein